MVVVRTLYSCYTPEPIRNHTCVHCGSLSQNGACVCRRCSKVLRLVTVWLSDINYSVEYEISFKNERIRMTCDCGRLFERGIYNLPKTKQNCGMCICPWESWYDIPQNYKFKNSTLTFNNKFISNKHGSSEIECLCDCGKTTTKQLSYLLKSTCHETTCGMCKYDFADFENVPIGYVFDNTNLELVEYVTKNGAKSNVLVRCTCGNEDVKTLNSITRGKTKSCGFCKITGFDVCSRDAEFVTNDKELSGILGYRSSQLYEKIINERVVRRHHLNIEDYVRNSYRVRNHQKRFCFDITKEGVQIIVDTCHKTLSNNTLQILKTRFDVVPCELIQNQRPELRFFFVLHEVFDDLIQQKPVLNKFGNSYFVDGYVESTNVAIEFDEPSHFSEVNQELDRTRQLFITNELSCRFIRVDARPFFRGELSLLELACDTLVTYGQLVCLDMSVVIDDLRNKFTDSDFDRLFVPEIFERVPVEKVPTQYFEEPICVFNTDGEFLFEVCTTDDEESLKQQGFNLRDILSVCNGKYLTNRGLMFKFARNCTKKDDFYEDIPPKRDLVKRQKRDVIVGNRVSCYTVDGKFVKSFNSQSEASKYFNVNQKGIYCALNGIQRTCAGYVWKRD